MKKYVIEFASVFLSLFLLFGCGEKKEVPLAGTSTVGEMSTQPTELSGEEGIRQNEKEDGDVGKLESMPVGSTPAESTNYVFELLENYKEKNIPPVYTQENENEQYSNVLFNKEGEIEYYTHEEKEGGYSVWKYTLKENITKKDAQEVGLWNYRNQAAWVREPVLWLEGLRTQISYGRVTPFRGEDRNDYAWYIGEGEKAHLVKREGDSYTEIPVQDWRITEQATVAVLENGNVVSADAGRECFVYDPQDGHLLVNFQCGWYESICIHGNLIYISASGGASVQCYDAEKQEFLPAMEAVFDNSVRIARQGEDVYVCTPKGIFRAKESDTSFQKVMEAGTFHFGREDINLLKFFVSGEAFYVVYGEDKGSIKKYSPAGEGDGTSNSVVVYSLENNALILDMISEFQNEYPDIELVYETGEGADGSITTYDRVRALNARILAGDGPDVLLLDGLPVESYIQKGILMDLNLLSGSWKEELLPNILEVYRTGESLYELPLRVRIPVFMTSGQSPEQYSTLENLVEYSEAEGGVANMDYSYANILQILYYNYTPDIFSENMAVSREVIGQFLNLAKRFCEAEQVRETASWTRSYITGLNQMGSFFAEGKADLGFLVLCGGYELSVNPAAVAERGGKLVGNQGIFFPNGLLGINQFSTQKELASLFVQFAFSYETQGRYVNDSGYPIHKEVLGDYEKLDLSYLMTGNGTVVLRNFTAEESAQMIQLVKQAYCPVTVEKNVWEILVDSAEDYLKGKKGLEKSVDEIASRLQLYFYEQ